MSGDPYAPADENLRNGRTTGGPSAARQAVQRQVAAREQSAAVPANPGLVWQQADGAVANPIVLLEGDEGSGKTTQLVLLSRSKSVGSVYALELGEGGRLREYGGTLPGCSVRVLTHDGSYTQILERVVAVKQEAARAKAAGEKPVVLGIDSFTFFWSGLSEWTNKRARESRSGQRKLAEDANAEIDPGRHLWNDANSRYNRVFNQLATFPGIVVVTCRGSWVSQTEKATGQPYKDGRQEYSVQCQKGLPYAAGVWVRMTREADPQIIACKSGHMGIRYVKRRDGGEPNTRQIDVPQKRDLLDYLIFDLMKYDVLKAGDDQVRVFDAGPLDLNETAAEVDAEAKGEMLREPRRPPQQRHTETTAATSNKAVESACMVAAWATRCNDAEALDAAIKTATDRGVADVEVQSALTADQAAAAGIGAPPVTLSAWLAACAAFVAANGGMSVADAVAAASAAPEGNAA